MMDQPDYEAWRTRSGESQSRQPNGHRRMGELVDDYRIPALAAEGADEPD